MVLYQYVRRHGSFIAILAVATILYVATYLTLSVNGKYVRRPSGERRYAGFGLAAWDRSLWQPVGVRWERRRDITGEYVTDGNELGWLFLPMLIIDRTWFHETHSLYED
ncbi:hypothetical protein GC163_00015 [bacterium]|nr:hypothetical protein [bacterium]